MAATSTFVFRADASLQIGTGHVMRCLALARQLQKQSIECHFICQSLVANLADDLKSSGFEIHMLPTTSQNKTLTEQVHSQNADWEHDAKLTASIIADIKAEWVVMDHYGLDIRWQETAVPTGVRLMVIDDLANRPHRSNILINPNLGWHPANYQALVAPSCKVLTGPDYAIIRPEFAERRAHALAERSNRSLKKILIAMGGIDEPDATSQVLCAIGGLDLPETIECTVVLGHAAPALQEVKALAEQLPYPCRVIVNASKMQDLMSEADLAIGAVGGTAWERCVLGLPSLLLTIATNQKHGAEALNSAGAGILLGDISDLGWKETLHSAIGTLLDQRELLRLSDMCSLICDGDGVLRIINRLQNHPLDSRPAKMEDSRRIWEWRRAGGSNRYYKSPNDVSYSDHYKWMQRALGNPDVSITVLTKSTLPIGYVRYDRIDNKKAGISICLSQHQRGQGLAGSALQIAHHSATAAGYQELVAEIHPDNVASLRLFAAAGYIEIPSKTVFKTYLFKLSDPDQ